jgi:hypothetical protein
MNVDLFDVFAAELARRVVRLVGEPQAFVVVDPRPYVDAGVEQATGEATGPAEEVDGLDAVRLVPLGR